MSFWRNEGVTYLFNSHGVDEMNVSDPDALLSVARVFSCDDVESLAWLLLANSAMDGILRIYTITAMRGMRAQPTRFVSPEQPDIPPAPRVDDSASCSDEDIPLSSRLAALGDKSHIDDSFSEEDLPLNVRLKNRSEIPASESAQSDESSAPVKNKGGRPRKRKRGRPKQSQATIKQRRRLAQKKYEAKKREERNQSKATYKKKIILRNKLMLPRGTKPRILR